MFKRRSDQIRFNGRERVLASCRCRRLALGPAGPSADRPRSRLQGHGHAASRAPIAGCRRAWAAGSRSPPSRLQREGRLAARGPGRDDGPAGPGALPRRRRPARRRGRRRRPDLGRAGRSPDDASTTTVAADARRRSPPPRPAPEQARRADPARRRPRLQAAPETGRLRRGRPGQGDRQIGAGGAPPRRRPPPRRPRPPTEHVLHRFRVISLAAIRLRSRPRPSTAPPAGPAGDRRRPRLRRRLRRLRDRRQRRRRCARPSATTATPELAKALLKRPPRLPANVKVPKAKVAQRRPGALARRRLPGQRLAAAGRRDQRAAARDGTAERRGLARHQRARLRWGTLARSARSPRPPPPPWRSPSRSPWRGPTRYRRSPATHRRCHRRLRHHGPAQHRGPAPAHRRHAPAPRRSTANDRWRRRRPRWRPAPPTRRPPQRRRLAGDGADGEAEAERRRRAAAGADGALPAPSTRAGDPLAAHLQPAPPPACRRS